MFESGRVDKSLGIQVTKKYMAKIKYHLNTWHYGPVFEWLFKKQTEIVSFNSTIVSNISMVPVFEYQYLDESSIRSLLYYFERGNQIAHLAS